MKKPLGRGLDTLIPRNAVRTTEPSGTGLLELNITEIIPNDNQPRQTFDDVLLNELAESIKEKGVVVPIIVTKVDSGKYMIIEGERRWRASGLAQKRTIPAIVRNVDTPKERLELALITNAQREDLNAIELASAYKELIDTHQYRQEDLGKIVGVSRAAVTNRLRLLSLPQEVCDALQQKLITEGHARAMLPLGSKSKMIELMNRIIDKNLSVREAEAYSSRVKKEKTAQEYVPDPLDVELKKITGEFETFFNTKVNIKHKSKGGVIEIKYRSVDELNTIINNIRGEVC